jgi:hypothetical protein
VTSWIKELEISPKRFDRLLDQFPIDFVKLRRWIPAMHTPHECRSGTAVSGQTIARQTSRQFGIPWVPPCLTGFVIHGEIGEEPWPTERDQAKELNS